MAIISECLCYECGNRLDIREYIMDAGDELSIRVELCNDCIEVRKELKEEEINYLRIEIEKLKKEVLGLSK
jgi:SMC interacting uncharacterized protein involved in chromosome segregation